MLQLESELGARLEADWLFQLKNHPVRDTRVRHHGPALGIVGFTIDQLGSSKAILSKVDQGGSDLEFLRQLGIVLRPGSDLKLRQHEVAIRCPAWAGGRQLIIHQYFEPD